MRIVKCFGLSGVLVITLALLSGCEPAGAPGGSGRPSSATQSAPAASPTFLPDSPVAITGLADNGQYTGIKVTRVTETEVYFTTADGAFGVRLIAEIPRIAIRDNADFNKAETFMATDKFAEAAAAYKTPLARQADGDLKSLVAARLALAERLAKEGRPKPASQPAVIPDSNVFTMRTLDLGNGVTMKLVLVPAGRFMMGSPNNEKGRRDDEGPVREVTISKPFYMGAYEVTRGQFARFVAATEYRTQAETTGWAYTAVNGRWDRLSGASWRAPGFQQTNDHPAVCVSHDDAMAFCRWLSTKTAQTVKLPTEAQREYACRARTKTPYPWGSDPDGGKGWANCTDVTGNKACPPGEAPFNWDDGYAYTSPVGSFKPNAFGLYDMIGNVSEWCSDWYAPAYDINVGSIDPLGPASGEMHTSRGGSWFDGQPTSRSACRRKGLPDDRGSCIGFRIIVE